MPCWVYPTSKWNLTNRPYEVAFLIVFIILLGGEPTSDFSKAKCEFSTGIELEALAQGS